MSLSSWFLWLRRQLDYPRQPGNPRPAAARLRIEGLSDRVTPSHGGFAFFYSFGGPMGFGVARMADPPIPTDGTDSMGGTTGDPGTPPPPMGGCGGGSWGDWSGGSDSTTSAVATHFDIRTQLDPHTGETTNVTVTALDASNHPVRDYTGTVRLTDTDAAATMPADYTFTADDRGRHTFTITPGADGTQTLTATDTTTATITGTVDLNVTPAPAATHFRVIALRNAETGTATDFVVVALDASNHPVRNYTGAVHLTSSDTAAVLPADYTFTAADNGVHKFSVTLNTAGSQTVTATDTTTSTITATVTVTAGADTGGSGGMGWGGGRWVHHHRHGHW
ncbi:MAG TPA: hypothetical protein VHR66_06980 [Gemmataceae bacterium]|jgi:hypothetical protein|nr:hypothetical protein [Gemmataceae bacterium]